MTSIVHVMGWRSQQYGSFERFLVALSRRCEQEGATTTLVFRARPSSSAFLSDVPAQVRVLSGARTPADPRFALDLARLLRGAHATHMHAHFGTDAYEALAVARAAGVRRRYSTKHIMPSSGVRSALRHRWLGAQVETFFGVSEQVTQRLCSLGVPRDKAVLCRLGVDAAAYQVPPGTRGVVRAELAIPEGARIVLSTSHLRPGKGVELLPALVAGLTDAVLVLAGEGPLRSALQDSADRLGLGSRLRLLGLRQDVPRLLAAADLVVFPTTANEGLPLGPLEAVAAGVPLVASAVSDLPALLGGLVTLVPPGDASALTAACLQVLRDPAAARLRADTAARHVAAELSVQRATDIHLQHYLRAADATGGRPPSAAAR